MKRVVLSIVAALVVLMFASAASAATYYSQGSVAPNTLTNWNTNRLGGGSAPANFTTAGDIFVIQGTGNGGTSPHNMTTNAAWTFGAAGSKLQIENGATLTATSAVTINSATATFQIDGGGNYVHNNATAFASSIFNGIESFAATSTVILNATNTTGPSGVTFGNLNVNLTTDPLAVVQCGGGITTINGDFTISNTQNREFRLSASGSTLAVGGNFSQSGGILSLVSGNSATGSLNVAGDFSHTGGTITVGGNPSTNGQIVFNKSGTQTFTSGGTVSGNIDFTVNSGSTLQMAAAGTIVSGRNFTLSSGATLGITSGAGITTSGATGNIQSTSTRSYSTGASYIYNGSVAQVTGNGLPATVNNLTANNASGVTLSAPVTITTALTIGSIISNTTFNDGGNQITSAGTLNLANASTFKLGSAASGTSFPAFTTRNIAVITTVEYASNQPQTIAAVNYSNLTSSGSGARTLASTGTIGIGEAFTPGTNSYTITNSTIDYQKGSTQTVRPFNYYNLSNSGNGQRTYEAGTVRIAGSFDYGGGGPHTVTGNTIEFNGTSAQSLPNQGFHYNNLTINNAAGFTVGVGSPLDVAGTLALVTGQLSAASNLTMLNGATIDRSGGNVDSAPVFGSSVNVIYSGATAVNAGPEIPTSTSTLNNLTINKSGGVTLTANAQANGVLTLTSGIVTTTDSFTLILGGSASSTGASSSSYVKGNLKKIYSSTGSFKFDVGDAGYSPVTVDATAGTGDFTANAVHGFALSNANNNVLERFWILTNNGITLANLTFQWLATDVHPLGDTVTELSYKAFKKDNGAATIVPLSSADPTTHTGTATAQTSFSTWTFAAPTAPTAVKLSHWAAESYSDGVQLNWESGFEVNNLGYHIYRERNGERERLTPAVIAGSALKIGPQNRLRAGFAYAWFDSQGTPETAYYLEAIDLNGTSDLIGPIYPARGTGKSPSKQNRAALLSEVSADAETASPARFEESLPASMDKSARTKSDDRFEANSASAPMAALTLTTLPNAAAVKISVSRAGWYRLTQAELMAGGLDANADPRRLQMFVKGEEIPIIVNSNGSRLAAGDSIEFYGQPLDTLSTDTQVYWLINGSSSGKRIIRAKSVKPSNQDWNSLTGGSFGMTVTREDKLIYFSSLLNGEESNIFGPVITSNAVTQSLTVSNLDASSTQAQLSVTVQGATDVDHQVQVQLNGTPVGVVSFAGRQHPTQNFTVARSLVNEGANVVTLAAIGGDTDVSLVDTVSVTYAHTYRADNNALRFSVPANRTAIVTGFSSPAIRLIDITNPAIPNEIVPPIAAFGGGYAFRLQTASNTGTRTFMAFTDDLASHPSALKANQPSNLTAMPAVDMLIVTHRDFRAAVEPLAAQRRSEGLTVSVVDIEDIYDEFSFGAHSPNALHDFLSWTNAHWAHPPRYLLLVGDSSWDPRNSLDQGFGDFVPTKLIDTAYLETASDDWLSDFDADGIADVATGRLPARTAADATLMVNKILAYEQERQAGTPLRGALMVSDTGFETESQATAALLPSNIQVTSINRADGSDDLTRAQIVDNLNNGPLVANYFGHGSVTVWTGAGLLNSALATSLTNTNRPTLFVLMTCLNGYSQDAYIDSLAESALKAPQGGAMAVWASSGFTEPQPQFVMSSEFYRQLFSSPAVRLGDGFKPAKLTISDKDVQRTWLLLGDPSMRLR